MAAKQKLTGSDFVYVGTCYFLLIVGLVIVLYPMLYVLSASFSSPLYVASGDMYLFPKGVSLMAYETVFKDQRIMMGYRNSLIYTTLGVMVSLSLTMLGAFVLSRKEMPGRNLIMGLFIFTMYFSGGLIPTYLVVKGLGMTNTLWVMIIPFAMSTYNLIIARTFIQNTIPESLTEAATIDGCSNTGIFLKIILPLSKAIIAVLVIYYGVAQWNGYFTALIYLSDLNRQPLQIILRDILVRNDVAEMVDTAESTSSEFVMLIEVLKYAVAVVASVPMLILYPVVQKYFTKGVMIGAIKG
ncbi:MAG: carbohydrate ABC transporter permease [Bacillota bacterium]|nr:carbohydrate ABC transporter permease [Bacillota bacterium]